MQALSCCISTRQSAGQLAAPLFLSHLDLQSGKIWSSAFPVQRALSFCPGMGGGCLPAGSTSWAGWTVTFPFSDFAHIRKVQ